jgi:DNA invertase Pin-like site-specific DNA recombinase
MQIDALISVGCSRKDIYIDKVSGAKKERPGLDACIEALESGDTLLVWRLDRLGRTMSHLVILVEKLLEQNIGFRSLCDGAIDTTTASGELMFNIFSALAQFERRLIQERTRAGLSAARARGKKGGRKPIAANDPKVVTAKEMYKNKKIPIQQICKTLNISRSTLYRYVEIEKLQASA